MHLVSGISALQCVPLLGRTVTIPYIRGSLTVRGVNDLLDFQRGYFRMPDHHSDLFPSLSAADNLGDDDYIEHVAGILHVHPLKLTQTCDVRKTLRDRYRLNRIVRLAPSRSDRCTLCKDVLMARERVESTYCCSRKAHTMCLHTATVCAYCGEGWVMLPCCVCGRPCSARPVYRWNPQVDSTECCDANIHTQCLHHLFNSRCPCCNTQLDRDGYPHPPNSVECYVERRRMQRRNQRARNGTTP